MVGRSTGFGSGGPGSRAWPHSHGPPQHRRGNEVTWPDRIPRCPRRRASVQERRLSCTPKWRCSTSPTRSQLGPRPMCTGIIRAKRTLCGSASFSEASNIIEATMAYGAIPSSPLSPLSGGLTHPLGASFLGAPDPSSFASVLTSSFRGAGKEARKSWVRPLLVGAPHNRCQPSWPIAPEGVPSQEGCVRPNSTAGLRDLRLSEESATCLPPAQPWEVTGRCPGGETHRRNC